MPRGLNTIEILRLLDKSNCRKCGCPTCLAFASAVFKDQKRLDECPHLDREIIDQYGKKAPEQIPGPDPGPEDPIWKLKQKLSEMDLSAVAERLGIRFRDNKLTLKVCGKDFSVDSNGKFYSDIHIHSWITGPVLHYIINGAGKNVTGKWVSFRELKNGKDWYPFFVHQCERRLKKVADTYTDLFEDMLQLFNGKKVDNHYESDISLVLHPLPRVPILICYWKPEDGLESSLNVFFDSTATDNLNIESIYSLGTGLVTMFEKISLRHGFK